MICGQRKNYKIQKIKVFPTKAKTSFRARVQPWPRENSMSR